MPEHFSPEDFQSAVTIDHEETWNPETERKCRDLFASLGWELGSVMPEGLKKYFHEVALDYVPLDNPTQTEKDDFTHEAGSYLFKVGIRLKKGNIGNDPFRDPDAGYAIDLLEKLVDLKNR